MAATPEPIPVPAGEGFPGDPLRNGITALRLFLASAVLFFHLWPLGDLGTDPIQVLTGGQLRGGGTLAVVGFFGLSGYLLVHSRRRTSPVGFAWRRALRILPGYWIAIVATAVVVGPWYIAAAWLPGPNVSDLTAGNPPRTINYSLWTLFPEILCYAALAIIPVRAMVIAVPAILASLALIGAQLLPNGTAGEVFSFFVAFWTGATLAVVRIRPSGWTVLALLVTLVGATLLGRFVLAMPFVLAYTSLWIGFTLPLHWNWDISYGTYIYAWPITVALASLGAASMGLAGFAVLSLGATLIAASLSWVIVERPALRLKRVVPPRALSPTGS